MHDDNIALELNESSEKKEKEEKEKEVEFFYHLNKQIKSQSTFLSNVKILIQLSQGNKYVSPINAIVTPPPNK